VVGDEARSFGAAGEKPVHHVDGPEEAAAHLAFERRCGMGGGEFAVEIEGQDHGDGVSWSRQHASQREAIDAPNVMYAFFPQP
jgi:hypothetical protein